MNSQQRRKTRVFVHEVVLYPRSGERYFEFEQRLESAKGWLQWNTKRKNYILGIKNFNKQEFKFCHGPLASVFLLKWQ